MQKIIIMNNNNKSELFTYSIELEAQAATAAAEKKTLENRYCIWKAFKSFLFIFLPIVKFTPFLWIPFFMGIKIVPLFFISKIFHMYFNLIFLIFCWKLFYYSMTITTVLIEKIYNIFTNLLFVEFILCYIFFYAAQICYVF